MTRIFSICLGIVIAVSTLCSCDKGSDKVDNYYYWMLCNSGSETLTNPAEENLLRCQVKASLEEFDKKYSGKGQFGTDEEALAASKFEEASAALKTIHDKFIEKAAKFDNGEFSFKCEYYYSLKSSTSTFFKKTDSYEFSYVHTEQNENENIISVPFSTAQGVQTVKCTWSSFGLNVDAITSIARHGALKVFGKESREMYEGDTSYITSCELSKSGEFTIQFQLQDASRLPSLKGDWYVLVPVKVLSILGKENTIDLKLFYTIS